MGITVYSLLWVMQDLYHQPYDFRRLHDEDFGRPRDCNKLLVGSSTFALRSGIFRALYGFCQGSGSTEFCNKPGLLPSSQKLVLPRFEVLPLRK